MHSNLLLTSFVVVAISSRGDQCYNIYSDQVVNRGMHPKYYFARVRERKIEDRLGILISAS